MSKMQPCSTFTLFFLPINPSQTCFFFFTSWYASRKADKRKQRVLIKENIQDGSCGSKLSTPPHPHSSWSRATLKAVMVIILEGENSLLEHFLLHRSQESLLRVRLLSLSQLWCVSLLCLLSQQHRGSRFSSNPLVNHWLCTSVVCFLSQLPPLCS